MAELNGGQLAILLQNWNHPVIKPFLATTAAGLVAIAVYEKGLQIDIDMKRLNHLIAHFVAPELRRGVYIPEKRPSPNHPVSEIFGLVEAELFSAAKMTVRTGAPELIVLPSHTSGAPHTTNSPSVGTQAHSIGIRGNSSILGLAVAVAIAIATVAIFFTPKMYREYNTAKAQKLLEAQLSEELTTTTTLNDKLVKKLERVEEENKRLKRQLQEKDRETEVLHRKKHEAEGSVKMAREKLAQLEKKKTASAFFKLTTTEISGEDYNHDDLGQNTTGSNDCSQQDSSQQQDSHPGTPESPSKTTTTEEVNGEHSSLPVTELIPAFREVSIPNRKKREAWHNHWKSRAMLRVYSDDMVYKLTLPCFDDWFAGIGIATPAEKHEDRKLENGKVLEHTKCVHCLEWYTKKDMYNHLKTCKAFWELAIRCGYCKNVFKYNTAFFDQHVPDCRAQSMEEDAVEEHYTLAISEPREDLTTTTGSADGRQPLCD